MERNIWHHNIRKYVILIKAGLVALLIVAGLWCAEYQNRWQSRMDNVQELMQDLRKQDAEALFPKLWQDARCFPVRSSDSTRQNGGTQRENGDSRQSGGTQRENGDSRQSGGTQQENGGLRQRGGSQQNGSLSKSWGFDDGYGEGRSYGGSRRHEGIDIMAVDADAGELEVQSVSDGTVEQMGWLELGGYRVGIRSPGGLYFYYAHLDSYAAGLQKGDTVKAGTLLGYMGDTGYGQEGTRGKFPVHLHFGVYYDKNGEEKTIDPYRLLRCLETKL